MGHEALEVGRLTMYFNALYKLADSLKTSDPGFRKSMRISEVCRVKTGIYCYIAWVPF